MVLNIVVVPCHISSWISSLACWPQVKSSWVELRRAEWMESPRSQAVLSGPLPPLLVYSTRLSYHDIWIMWAHLAFYFIIRHLLMCLHICPALLYNKGKHHLLMKLNCSRFRPWSLTWVVQLLFAFTIKFSFICLIISLTPTGRMWNGLSWPSSLFWYLLFFLASAIPLGAWSNYSLENFFIVAAVKVKLATILF